MISKGLKTPKRSCQSSVSRAALNRASKKIFVLLTTKYNSVNKHRINWVFVLSSCDTAILKNLMLYLKTKSLTSENVFKRETKEVDEMFMDLLGVFQRYYDKAPEADKQTLRAMLDLIILVSEQVHSSHRHAESTIGDFKIYVTALEGSYKSVDGDFDKSVTQPAEREAEEKDQEEEERAKAIEEYSKRARPKFYE
jgi:hypothetical protein